MIGGAFARLSTGMKMLIILSTALLPLGLMAFFASLESARTSRLSREAEVRILAVDSAQRLTLFIDGLADRLHATVNTLPEGSVRSAACRRALEMARRAAPSRVEFALFDLDWRPICRTSGFAPAPAAGPAEGVGTEVRILEDDSVLRFAVAGKNAIVIGELPITTLAGLIGPDKRAAPYGVALRQGDADIVLTPPPGPAPLGHAVSVAAPVAGGQLVLEIAVNATPVRPIEILMILLPILMWLSAAIIGWLVVDRLVLSPITLMQKAIATHDIRNGPLILPAMMTPSHELRGLGNAFRTATDKLAAHETELEHALAQQTRLTREVHHRVKNNLQIVSSLINLHARGVSNEDVVDAYSSIQRRVDALAVVHRNHFAELEENRGVGLHPLIGELAANLRATFPPRAARMPITLQVMPAFVTQDVAAPVAFLITELTELAMSCDPGSGVAIKLEPMDRPDRARLTLIAPGLTTESCREHITLDRVFRVIEGLARQLRSPLRKDDEAGSYAIEIPIVPLADAGG